MRRRSILRIRAAALAGLSLIALAVSIASHAEDGAGHSDDATAASLQARAPGASPLGDALPASGFVWMPQLSQTGPLLIVVSLPDQRASVYRNGVRIGLSKVSTGRPGFETPTGVFTILQKDREHYSNLYDDAPMPFMQRLTWDGVAMHAGKVPDAPASHGCVRLPYAFSEKLFAVTHTGMTVVVSDVASGTADDTARSAPPPPAEPGAPAPSPSPSPLQVVSGDALPVVGDAPGIAPPDPGTAPRAADVWAPERAPDGPLVVVASLRDGQVRVLRNAVEIGRATMTAAPEALLGTRAYVLLDGAGTGTSLVAGRAPRRWLEVPLVPGSGERRVDLHELAASGALATSLPFARSVYDALVPGSSLVITDQPLGPLIHAQQPVLTADEPLSSAQGALPPRDPR